MIETFAVIFSLLSIWLTLKKSIFCWPIGAIGIIFYSILFFQNHDYCNMMLQSIFLIQSVIGWVNWNKPNSSKVSLYNEKFSTIQYFNLISMILLYSLLYYNFSMIIGGSNLFLDSITTSISIVAMSFLIQKKIEAWILWIIARYKSRRRGWV